jgi:hypothetical protein
MLRLNKSLNAWATPEFKEVLQHEIEQLDAGLLPLQQGLSISSHVTDRPIQAMVLGVSEEADLIRVKAGIFYTTLRPSPSRTNIVCCSSASTVSRPIPR